MHRDKDCGGLRSGRAAPIRELEDSRKGSWLVTTDDAVWLIDLDEHQFQTTQRRPPHGLRSSAGRDRQVLAGTLAFLAQCRTGEPLVAFFVERRSGELAYRVTSPVRRIVAASASGIAGHERGHDEAS